MIMKEQLRLKRLSNKKINACDISSDNRVFGFQAKEYAKQQLEDILYTMLQDSLTNTLIISFKNSASLQYGCKFSLDNQWFAFFDAKDIHIYNLQTNKLTQIPTRFHPIQLIINNKFVICCSNNGYQTIELEIFQNHYINQLNCTRISTHNSNLDLFISFGHIQYFLGHRIMSTIRIVYWHCRRDKWLKYFVIPHYYHDTNLYQAISKNFVATYFFAEYGNLKVSVYNHHTQKLLFSICVCVVASLAFSPCEKFLILKTFEYLILDISTRKIKTLPIEKGRYTFFSSNNQSIIETNMTNIRILKLQQE